MDRAALAQAADLLVSARRTGRLLDPLPASCQPQTLDDALAIQDAAVAALGEPVAGWKVSVVDGRVVRGAIFASRVFNSPARIEAAKMPLLGIEGEIAFQFERDLAPGQYTYEQVADAVTAFAAIEVVDSRFRDYPGAAFNDKVADFVSNGGFVRGPAVASWRKLDLVNIPVTETIGETQIVKQNGGNLAGDPLKPAVAFVNDIATGVKAGQFVTTGTYTGMVSAKPGQTAVVTFAGFGSVEVTFT